MTIINLIKIAEFSRSVENTVRKGEIARNEQFLFFPHCFRRLVPQTHKNQGLFGKGLTLFETTKFRLFETERLCRQQFEI